MPVTDAITVSGLSIGEEARDARETPGQDVVRTIDAPLAATGGLVILKGTMAPEGCVLKIGGHPRTTIRGTARG